MALKPKNLAQYSDYLGFTLLSSGCKFPTVGPFGDDHQANLMVAFQTLTESLPIVEKHLKDGEKSSRVKELLKNSLAAYQDGDNLTGGRLLDEINDIVAPNRYEEYARRKSSTP